MKIYSKKADEAQLAHAISNHVKNLYELPTKCILYTEYYVLDGGSLLHHLSWKNGATYGLIAVSYAEILLLFKGF